MMTQPMGWRPIEEEGWRKGPWTTEEDKILIEHVNLHGEGRWNSVARLRGLKRNGKSCRFRWVNYLRPDLKRGQITPHEENIIHELHAKWGNRWSTIARSLPGRTDNEIKNYWRTHFKKKDKTLPESPEKLQARLLRRQQFHMQQQQYQRNDIDTKMIVSFDENYNNSPTYTQLRQEIMYPSAPEEQGFFYSVMNECANLPDVSVNEDILWDGLWNLDDFNGNLTNRAIYQHTFATNFC